ncbi:MAG: hypothetical protein FIB01_09770 [Gemmatimonadetes bacterium]|nr:hypothetical protein [Gemmatimonadota bacterium]
MSYTGNGSVNWVSRYSPALYFVAALMLLMPPLDIILSMAEYAWGSAQWRWGAIGLVSGGMLLPIVGVLLASMTAVLAGQLWPNRVVMAVAVVLVLLLLLAAGLFSLDAIEIRHQATAVVRRRFDVAVIKTVLMQLTQALTLLLVVRSAWRADRALKVAMEARGTPELVTGMVGR